MGGMSGMGEMDGLGETSERWIRDSEFQYMLPPVGSHWSKQSPLNPSLGSEDSWPFRAWAQLFCWAM